MRKVTLFFISILLSVFLISCNESKDERAKSSGERIKGTVQETVGSLSGDDELKSEGKKNKLKGDARSTKEDIKDSLGGN